MRLSDGCKKVIKASIDECDVSIRQDNVMRKPNFQKKSGPAMPPARVTMRAITTSPALVGLGVISPAFLFRFCTDPEPTGAETLRSDCEGYITGVADLKNMGAYGAPPESYRWSL